MTGRIRLWPILLFVCLVVCLALTLLTFTPGSEAKKAGSSTKTAAVQSPNPGVSGQWTGVIELENVPVHISLLPDGRLLYWARDKADNFDRDMGCNTYILNLADPSKNKIIPNETTNLFCSGHSFLADGRLLVTGGHKRIEQKPGFEGYGSTDINIFDPGTDKWHKSDTQMQQGRWYPFNVMGEDGGVMTLYGFYWDGNVDSPGRRVNDIPEKLVVTGNNVAIKAFSATPAITYYPYLHLTPEGKVFVAGPLLNGNAGEWSFIFDPQGDNGAGSYSPTSNPGYDFYLGSSTLYDNGKVLMVGGVDNPPGSGMMNAAVVIDLLGRNGWQPTGLLNYRRQYLTTVLLPDGKVLAVGGTQCRSFTINCPDQAPGGGAVLTPELWDPTSQRWSVMAPNPSGIPRLYHSTALLLPDATVLVGGGGLPAMGGEMAGGTMCQGIPTDPFACKLFGHKDAEIFKPPYLFTASGQLAPRPVITSAPTGIGYGQSFFVGTANPGSITTVVLVRNPSVTHGFNQDQRRVVLTSTVNTSSTGLNVMAPIDGKLAPPGPYMLFLLDQNGTPSIAKMVNVGGGPGPRLNVALEANGGQATASSTYGPGYPARATINGETKGIGWGAGSGGWNDGTSNNFSDDSLEIQFNGEKRINEIDLFTLQDNYANPVTPTPETTFTAFGVTSFRVKYFENNQWVLLADIQNNNKVWRKLEFPALRTTKIRIEVTGGLAGYSRIVEVEAWEAPATTANVALEANGAQVTASSTYGPAYPARATINGETKGVGWAAGTGGWNDGTAGDFTDDTLIVQFNGEKRINEIDLFTLQDNYANPVTPTLDTTFTAFGVTSFRVDYWDSASSQWVPLSDVANNNKVWRKLEFAPLRTTKIRIKITGGLSGYSRIVEVEAWEAPATTANVALEANGAQVTASSTYGPAYPARATINGETKGVGWAAGTGGWNDGTAGDFTDDTLTIEFNGEKRINKINVFTLQDNYANPVTPTLDTMFSAFGVTAFRVDYWDSASSQWKLLSEVTNNNKVWRKLEFAALRTTKIRIKITNGLAGYSRIVEVEAWEGG